MEPKPGEVGIRIDASLQERVRAYAEREGLTFGESLTALLYLGLEFAERQRTGLKEDIEDLQRELRDLKQMVDRCADIRGPIAGRCAGPGTPQSLTPVRTVERSRTALGQRQTCRGYVTQVARVQTWR
jgi:hypothetical protein